jgi:hypothetical protein
MLSEQRDGPPRALITATLHRPGARTTTDARSTFDKVARQQSRIVCGSSGVGARTSEVQQFSGVMRRSSDARIRPMRPAQRPRLIDHI